MKKNEYRIEYTYSSRDDIRKMKKYVLDTFQYQEYAYDFTNKLKTAMNELKVIPAGFSVIGFQYRGYDIRMKPYHTCLIFYAVDSISKKVTVLRIFKDEMDWQYIIKQWLNHNES